MRRMCGIVGYIGVEKAAPIILDGLSKLEYRGYDSAGIAIFDGKKINIQKAVGRLKVLENLTHGERLCRGMQALGIQGGRRMGFPMTSIRIPTSIKKEP